MLSPSVLLSNDVPVCQLLQREGEFVVSFPQAYHCGFSHGFNCGEAVNFACPDWLEFGRASAESYRLLGRKSVFSFDRLVWTIGESVESKTNEAKLLKALKAEGIRGPGEAAGSSSSSSCTHGTTHVGGSSGCSLVLSEMRSLYQEELRLRAQLEDLGIVNTVQMPANIGEGTGVVDDAAIDYDDRRSCKHCKHACFFSAVICSCR